MLILEKTLGISSRKYALAQVVEARILKASGDTGRAHMEEVSAKRSLQALQNQHCNGCTVSVEALR
jgi:ATP/maltotriose-dependent transcriptional regulator MalT